MTKASEEPRLVIVARFTDGFNGNDRKLLDCISALLSMDAAGSLVPHGIGGHARGLLNAAAARLEIDGEIFRSLKKRIDEDIIAERAGAKQ